MSNLKRPRETYNNPSASTAPQSTSAGGKRVKFASDETLSSTKAGTVVEDDFELDLNDSSNATRKRDIVTDGYDSDSSAGSDGGFGVGGGRKGRVNKDGEEEAKGGDDDDDMFGGGEAAGKEAPTKKAKGANKEFLEMGDIEGQEFGKGEDGEVPVEAEEEEEEEDYLPDDDLANDDDAPRTSRNKTGMGFKLSSFNMQDELAEGRFSTDGSYVQNANDPLAKADVWLDGVSKSAIKAARESKKRMEDEARKREENDAKGEGALAQERDDCLIGMLSIVHEGESVASALARLGAAKKKVVRVRRPPKPKVDYNGDDAMDVDDGTTSRAPILSKGKERASVVDDDPAARKINLLTHYASTLLSVHGDLEIYDQTYADIIKTLKSEGAVRRDWAPPKDPDEEREAAEAEAAKAAAVNEARANDHNKPRPLIARPTAPVTSDKRYWYQWKSPPPGQPADQQHGPYPYTELNNWVTGGYFGERGSNIVVRVDGSDGWSSWEEVDT
ncbi:CD2 antigen cytoplasmic tail-binding protein 2, partial [Phenoliferia sp. Uapishka_3]